MYVTHGYYPSNHTFVKKHVYLLSYFYAKMCRATVLVYLESTKVLYGQQGIKEPFISTIQSFCIFFIEEANFPTHKTA